MKTLKKIGFYIAVPFIYIAMVIHTAYKLWYYKQVIKEAISPTKEQTENE